MFLTALFTILIIAGFGKFLGFALHAAWGLTKILFYIVFWPLLLVIMFAAGLVYIALPVAIIWLIVAFLVKA